MDVKVCKSQGTICFESQMQKEGIQKRIIGSYFKTQRVNLQGKENYNRRSEEDDGNNKQITIKNTNKFLNFI